MANGGWQHSTRRDRLPKNWVSVIRPAVLRRDHHQCRLRYEDICIGVATEVDHIERGDDHSMGNLQAACQPCHGRKSSQEGDQARPRLNRPPETHPALR